MENQINYYQDKLNYEMDSSDLFEAFLNGENITIVDARKKLLMRLNTFLRQ